ncbi:hypothetical protein Q9F25_003278 [Vibrio cholerae]
MIVNKDIYLESAQWIRMANSIIWTVGAIFIPISLSAFAYALTNKQLYFPLAFGSWLVWGVWLYIVYFYGYTAGKCRISIAKIEEESGLDPIHSIYTEQNRVFYGKFGFKNGFMVITAAFVLAWLIGYCFAVG